MVPMLDEAIELAAADGARKVVIGMAHRGRLNVLAHIIGRPYDVILREFEGERLLEAVTADPEGGTGDVKYHLRRRTARARRRAATSRSMLASNPSHLEFVDPVVEGSTRAAQTDHDAPAATARPERRARDPDPRRRRVPGPGRRRGDAEPRRRSPATRPAARCT